ncbi:patatin-like phospholipase family protein [Pleomorphomonas koreensis]|uniref:patatin-like phospholipase family protein n=1 Tax=Pleomorphomonas koreensis TaxID=257440 RepID=UPI0003F54673|nr:patatin-like phospholipase family protein [Pleomorphomonas koreensis]
MTTSPSAGIRRILSIDGGGMRGLCAAVVLAELERRLARRGKPAELSGHFDLIAGTSTGGILALGLALPDASGRHPLASPATLAHLYRTHGRDIFPRGPRQALRGLAALIHGPAYAADGLATVLDGLLGRRRLGEALTPVVVTAYDVEARRAVFLSSLDDASVLAAEAARATSAAPTYLPPALVTTRGRPTTLIDGGVFAGDPALAAYVEAVKARRRAGIADDGDILLVSIGTGLSVRGYAGADVARWGALGWIDPRAGAPIVSVLMHGQASTVAYQLNALINPPDVTLPDGLRTVPGGDPARQRYFRFNARLDGSAGDAMDDASPAGLAALEEVAARIIEAQSAELDHLADRL